MTQQFGALQANPIFDVEAVRADFPILGERPYGKPLVYLDNAASAQKPRQVLERLTQFYGREYANVHRGLHYLANASTEAFEGARESVRRFLNAESTDEIIFTRGATEALNLVASSFGQAHISEGDEIILSVMEHHSNIVPWHFLRERKGAVLKWIEVDDDGVFSLDAFEQLITPRTKIVALTHMSNVVGARRRCAMSCASPMRMGFRSSPTDRKAPCILTSTCGPWTSTSMSSPDISSTARPASARFTASANGSKNCRPSPAAAR